MKTFQGKDFLSALRMALLSLNEHTEELNRLNVFPVPDGDTGLNMSKTLAPILRLENDLTLSEAADAVSEEVLKASRGNSGTILATFFLGFAEGLSGLDEADSAALLKAFKRGRDEAYLAVASPSEGTILTVMSAASDLTPLPTIEATFHAMEKATSAAVKKTPELLPILKKNHVVDSGGLGFYYLIKGFLTSVEPAKEKVGAELSSLQDGHEAFEEDLSYRFCTEGVLRKNPEYQGLHGAKVLEEQLSTLGGSLVFLETASLIKFHLHTDDDELVHTAASRFGVFLDFKVDNLYLEVHNEAHLSSSLGFILATDGAGFVAAFSDFPIQQVQVDMSQGELSYEELEQAIVSLRSKRIVIFPNNKNILPTCYLLKRKYPTLEIIPTKDEPSAIVCLEAYDPEREAEANLLAMRKALEGSLTLSLAAAEKSYHGEKVSAEKGDWLLLKGTEILASEKNLTGLFPRLVSLLQPYNEITIYAGERSTEKDAQALIAYFQKTLPGLSDATLLEGEQLSFPFFISGEKA